MKVKNLQEKCEISLGKTNNYYTVKSLGLCP